MEFAFITSYDQKAMEAMARALRKTVRKKHSRRSHILGWIVVVIALLLILPIGDKDFVFTFQTLLTWLVMIVIVAALLKEDVINGYIARKRALPGLKTSNVVFKKEGYRSVTEVGASDFRYENITALAETKNYFVFIFSKSHAQVYDKRSLTGGSVDAFREFMEAATGLRVQRVN